MKQARSLATLSLFSLVAIVLTACASTPGLRYTVAEPAKNSHAASLRRVAVMGFTGWRGGDFARAFDASLREARFEGRPWFDVTAPTGDPALYTGGFGPSAHARAVEFGEAYGLDGVWYGDVDTESWASHVYYETRKKCVEWDGLFDCETRKEYEVACRDYDARATARMVLVDVKTGHIVVDRLFTDDDSDRDCWERDEYRKHRHGYYDRGFGHSAFHSAAPGMEHGLLMSLSGRLRQEIAPYTRTEKAELMETPSLPYMDLTNGFAQAVELAKDGRGRSACDLFETMSARYGEEDAALAYNLAACSEMAGDLDAAHDRYAFALKLGGATLSEDFLSQADKALRRLGALEVDRAAMDYLLGAGEPAPSVN